MVIFLYGPDTYRSRRKLNEIIEYYKKVHKSGLDLKYLDGENLNFGDFKNEIQQTSIFDEKKLIVLKNVFLNSEFKKEFLRNSKKYLNSKEVILFYDGREIASTDPLFKFLKKYGKSQEFKLLGGQGLKNWVKKEFLELKAEISPAALSQLINFVGNNSWQMSNEIKKLASFKLGRKIETKDVELLVKPKIESDIFKTIDAVALKDGKQAISLIHNHLEKGDSPLYLFSMINFQFRNLLMIKSEVINEIQGPQVNDLGKRLGIHPFVVRKTLWQARKFTIEELKKIYQKIFQADLNIKTGKIDPETALDLFIAEI